MLLKVGHELYLTLPNRQNHLGAALAPCFVILLGSRYDMLKPTNTAVPLASWVTQHLEPHVKLAVILANLCHCQWMMQSGVLPGMNYQVKIFQTAIGVGHLTDLWKASHRNLHWECFAVNLSKVFVLNSIKSYLKCSFQGFSLSDYRKDWCNLSDIFYTQKANKNFCCQFGRELQLQFVHEGNKYRCTAKHCCDRDRK